MNHEVEGAVIEDACDADVARAKIAIACLHKVFADRNLTHLDGVLSHVGRALGTLADRVMGPANLDTILQLRVLADALDPKPDL